MRAIRALFDGKVIIPIEPVTDRKKTEVLVIFPNDVARIPPDKARALLRGKGRGELLTQKLLESRLEDVRLDRK